MGIAASRTKPKKLMLWRRRVYCLVNNDNNTYIDNLTKTNSNNDIYY